MGFISLMTMALVSPLFPLNIVYLVIEKPKLKCKIQSEKAVEYFVQIVNNNSVLPKAPWVPNQRTLPTNPGIP